MDRSWDQRSAEIDLSSYPYRLEVRGTPRSLTWPDVCVHCAAGATERVRVRRAFYRRARGRRYSGLSGYRVVSADLPLCAACAARHRETVPQVSLFRRYRWWLLNPAHIATIGCAALLVMVQPGQLDLPGTSTGLMATWGLSGIFGNAATRLEPFVVSTGAFAYGGYPDIDGLFQEQASELDPKKRGAILQHIQQLVHDKVMVLPIWQLALLQAYGPRVAESGLGLIADFPWAAPYEELRLKP